ncbi:unnamed protein product, partial [Rotaria sp. Silwood1]
TIRYCSTFEAYVHERESLRMAFLLNKYSNKCIDEQFNKTWSKFYIHETIDYNNYDRLRQKIIEHPEKEKTLIDYNNFICLWKKYFAESPIDDVIPVLGNILFKDNMEIKYLLANLLLETIANVSISITNTSI